MNRTFLSETKILRIAQVLSQAFTVNVTTDIITSTAHGLSNEDRVVLTTTTTLPAGLSPLTKYYVINATTNTFQLSLKLYFLAPVLPGHNFQPSVLHKDLVLEVGIY